MNSQEIVNEENPNIYLFEEEIVLLEKKVRSWKNMEELIVFYGSSSIRLWETLEQDLLPLNSINLGFGGSSFAWCIYYFDRLAAALPPPKRFVLYVGDNDLGKGIPPKKIVLKFRKLVQKIHLKFPRTPIDFISIKPSPERDHLMPRTRLTNQLIRKELLGLSKSNVINVFDSMLDEYGKARPELYLDDNLHLNQDGYRIWRGVVRKFYGI